MKVFIANFGTANWAWKDCLERSTIAVMDDVRVHPYWQRGDQEGYVAEATAWQTVAQSGRESLVVAKNKRAGFLTKQELEAYITEMIEGQEGLCALTGLAMILDTLDGDVELRCSLDRIDSSGHYERGNLQIVCRFANRWKGASNDADFKRLISLLRPGREI